MMKMKVKAPKKIRTEINPVASSLSSTSLKSARRPPPSLTLLDVTPGCHKTGSFRKSGRRRSYKDSLEAYKYQYHPTSINKKGRQRLHEDEDCRSFIDWLFMRPFRCKQSGYQSSDKSDNIATIFSMPGMPSAAELLCGSIDNAFIFEQILVDAAGILGQDRSKGLARQYANKALSEVSFTVGSGPLIRYTNNGDDFMVPTPSCGGVSEEAFNTLKRICGFGYKDNVLQVFTKQVISCPSNKLHQVELRKTPLTSSEIVFRLGRKHTDLESRTIIEDACHRFLANSIEENSFHLLITGPPSSGKSSILREFKKVLSKSTGFYKWNVIYGNVVANQMDPGDDFSLCLQSYIEEIISSNNGKKSEQHPYVLMFDDLSLENGVPTAQDSAQRCGINMIATLGSNNKSKCSDTTIRKLSKVIVQTSNCTSKSMILEIRPYDNHRTMESIRKRKRSETVSKYKLITICNYSKKKQKTVQD